MIDLTDVIANNVKSIYSTDATSADIDAGTIKKETETGLDSVKAGMVPENVNYSTAENKNLNATSIKINNNISTKNRSDRLSKQEINTGIKENNRRGLRDQAGNNLFSGTLLKEPLEIDNPPSNEKKLEEEIDTSSFLDVGRKTPLTMTEKLGFTPDQIKTQLQAGIKSATEGLIGKNNDYGIKPQSHHEIETAKSRDETKINLLLANSKAYLTSSYVANIVGAGSALGVAAGITSSLVDAMTSRQYWSEDEFAKITAANFDTLSSGNSDSDMTIKSFTGGSKKGDDFESLSDGSYYDKPTQANDGTWKIEESNKHYFARMDGIAKEDDFYKYEISYPKDNELTKMVNEMRTKKTSIGFIYVNPLTNDQNYSPFKIPFEFNPIISESSIEARYNSVSLLSRIGDLRSYVGTSPLTVTIKTDYLITTDVIEGKLHGINAENDTGLLPNNEAIPSTFKKSETDSSSSGATGTNDHYARWMDYYNQDIIYSIETAYRSLVLPDFSKNTDNNTTTYSYIRPPLVKIVMSNLNDPEANGNSGIYELAYPIFESTDTTYSTRNVLASQKGKKFSFHKSFVVTGITINKTFETNNAYYDTNGALRFNGFSVEMTLVEVTQAYTDVMPDYNIYQSRFSKTIGSDSDYLFGKMGR